MTPAYFALAYSGWVFAIVLVAVWVGEDRKHARNARHKRRPNEELLVRCGNLELEIGGLREENLALRLERQILAKENLALRITVAEVTRHPSTGADVLPFRGRSS